MIPNVPGMLAALVVGGFLAALTPSALAQGSGSSGLLGGFGPPSSYANPAMVGSSPMVIPYGGMFEGFMPSRMGGGGGSSTLAFRSRPTATMGSSRTSFSLSPSLGGMGQGRGGRARMSSRTGGGMGVMPPSIGYPFRQPPSLVPSSNPVSGMSM
jgi:hypothetical protein